MAKMARSFEQRTHQTLLRGIKQAEHETCDPPWELVPANAMPPMMFELRSRDGTMTSYPYSDVRKIRCRDAGCVELYLLSLEKLMISIHGRHLRDLARSFGSGMVRWVQEGDHRDSKPEEAPEINVIDVCVIE